MVRVQNYFQRRKVGFTCTSLVLISLLLILFSSRNLTIRPKEIGQSFLSVFQISAFRVGSWIGDTWNSISELKRLQQELGLARRRLAEYEGLSRDLVELRQENAQLKEQLDLSRALPFKQIPAEVIGKDPGNLFSTIVINKGSSGGLRRGMPVVAFQRGLQGLVGKVIEVSLFSATVLPIFDPASYVAARLQDSRYDGLVNGGRLGQGRLIMQYVKKLAKNEVQYAELVISSGMGGVFPKGIHIGRVREIRARSYEASLELEIEPIVDFSRLEYVFVLDNEG